MPALAKGMLASVVGGGWRKQGLPSKFRSRGLSIEDAVEVVLQWSCENQALLKCISAGRVISFL